MLDDALHHVVPVPVSDQRLNLVQHLRDKLQELYPGTVFQEALHDAASKAMPGNTYSVASEFMNHERHGIRRQQFDAFLHAWGERMASRTWPRSPTASAILLVPILQWSYSGTPDLRHILA